MDSKYGNPTKNGKLNPEWYRNNIITVNLPYPMRLAWNKNTIVQSVSFHKLGADNLKNALTLAYRYARLQVKQKYGYDESTEFYDINTIRYLQRLGLDLLGGTFEYRLIRGSKTKISQHSTGTAIDVNPEKNRLGTHGCMPDWFVRCFTKNGFTWGGKWKKRPDPMHMELK